MYMNKDFRIWLYKRKNVSHIRLFPRVQTLRNFLIFEMPSISLSVFMSVFAGTTHFTLQYRMSYYL
jgi:hypothetical protein